MGDRLGNSGANHMGLDFDAGGFIVELSYSQVKLFQAGSSEYSRLIESQT